MRLIVCVDDRMGMAFGVRRQSRDSVVCADIEKLTAGQRVKMDLRSEKLFSTIAVDVDAENCFLEFTPPSALGRLPQQIVLYRWNRHYPADVRFDLPLERYALKERTEFAGTSHEKITREVYEYEA